MSKFIWAFVLAATMSVAAAAQRSTPVSQPESNGPPPRDEAGSMSTMSDEQLWAYISKYRGNKALVGIKKPGTARGIWKKEWLVAESEFHGAVAALGTGPDGLRFESVTLPLPAVIVELPDLAALRRLRRLPFVDYVEPVYHDGFQVADSGSGCTESGNWLGGKPYPDFSWEARTPEGDIVPWNFGDIKVPEAWTRGVTGAGKTVAVLDTGVFLTQTQLQMPGFAGGLSGNRTIEHLNPFFGDPWDRCNHGTRMAGVIGAPRDGNSVVGVAYGASLASYRVHNDVVVLDAWNEVMISEAIWDAVAVRHLPIVAMAFGTMFHLQYMSDSIDAAYAAFNVLFVAAAGTPPGCLFNYGVVFPARKPNVIAVTGVRWEDNQPSEYSCWGPEVDIAAVIGEHSPGLGRYTFCANCGENAAITFGGSSNATALVAGVAALVWSEYPWMHRDQVRDRLYATASGGIAGKTGYGRVNAYRAVGGFNSARIDGPTTTQPFQQYTLTAMPQGDGPFSFRWSNGATTRSVSGVSGDYGSNATWTVEVRDLRENKPITVSRTVTTPPIGDGPELCFDPIRRKLVACH